MSKTKKFYDRTFYKGFEYHLDEAANEFGVKIKRTSDPDIAVFSKSYYNKIQAINCKKKYDYCFVGNLSFQHDFGKHRQWVVEFAKKHFTKNSIFVNTEGKHWDTIGPFDYTNDKSFERFCPRYVANNQSREAQYREVIENYRYFQTMRQSKFTLCPRGDAPWSFRFYECLMCGTIPVVENEEHSFRTATEGQFDYKFVLAHELPHEFKESMVEHNDNIFRKCHMLNHVVYEQIQKPKEVKAEKQKPQASIVCKPNYKYKMFL